MADCDVLGQRYGCTPAAIAEEYEFNAACAILGDMAGKAATPGRINMRAPGAVEAFKRTM